MTENTGTTTPELNIANTSEVVEKRETSKNLPPKLTEPSQWHIWKVKMTLHLKSVGQGNTTIQCTADVRKPNR